MDCHLCQLYYRGSANFTLTWWFTQYGNFPKYVMIQGKKGWKKYISVFLLFECSKCFAIPDFCDSWLLRGAASFLEQLTDNYQLCYEITVPQTVFWFIVAEWKKSGFASSHNSLFLTSKMHTFSLQFTVYKLAI